MKRLLLILITLAHFAAFGGDDGKMNGVNFVAPARKVDVECMNSLEEISAEWVALNPYAYCEFDDPEVRFDVLWQWWGEKREGTEHLIKYARERGKKIMVKPHIWVKGQGWGGDLDFNEERDWQRWETSYLAYIMAHAKLAEKYKVELFCVGTEIRKSAKNRPKFWRRLIRQVRGVYSGKLTYASNWDNFYNVSFWDQLDFIGVDAYFPLVEDEEPNVEKLEEAWSPHLKELEDVSTRTNRPVVFTEYGYKSISKTAWRQWELPEHWNSIGHKANLQAQINAYMAIYKSFWSLDWFAGGFIWKWYADTKAGGPSNIDYTPQNKPVQKVIKEWYLRSQ